MIDLLLVEIIIMYYILVPVGNTFNKKIVKDNRAEERNRWTIDERSSFC